MKGHMRGHIWMHVGLLVAIGAVFGLSAIGVAVPSAFVYLIVLACPLMMIVMMLGMGSDHDHGKADPTDGVQPGVDRPKLEQHDVVR